MTLQGNHFLGEAQIERLRPRVTFNLANLWEVRRVDGTVLRFATTDKQVYFEGNWFKATGPSPSDLQQGEALAETDFEMAGVLDHENITAQDLYSGLYDEAQIVHWVVDLDRPWVWFRKHVWWIKQITVITGQFKAEIVGVEKFLTIPIGRRYEKDCDKVLGSIECGATNAATIVTAISEVPTTASGGAINGTILDTGAFVVPHPGGAGFPTVAASGLPPTWSFGKVEFTSGANIGVVIQIGYESGSEEVDTAMSVTLAFPAPYNIRVGDTVTITGGCDGTLTTCRTVFDNEINFGGIPYMPKTSKLYESPQQATAVEEIDC